MHIVEMDFWRTNHNFVIMVAWSYDGYEHLRSHDLVEWDQMLLIQQRVQGGIWEETNGIHIEDLRHYIGELVMYICRVSQLIQGYPMFQVQNIQHFLWQHHRLFQEVKSMASRLEDRPESSQYSKVKPFHQKREKNDYHQVIAFILNDWE
jgi:hypothetical protein